MRGEVNTGTIFCDSMIPTKISRVFGWMYNEGYKGAVTFFIVFG
jgi:hypothetical protein